MDLNICQIIILVGLILGVIYSTVLLFFPQLKSKSNFYLSLLLLVFVGNLSQYWLRDVGLISARTFQLIYLPWPILITPIFWLYIEALKIFDRPSRLKKWMWIPVILVFIIQLIIKGVIISSSDISMYQRPWVIGLNLLDEYILIIYSLIISLAIYRSLRVEIKSSNLKGFGLNKSTIQPILFILFAGIIVAIVWTISFLLNNMGVLSNYYLTWLLMVVTLNLLGINGIYNKIQHGPDELLRIPIYHSTALTESSKPTPQGLSRQEAVESPLRYYDKSVMDSLVLLNSKAVSIMDIRQLDALFSLWVKEHTPSDKVKFIRDVDARSNFNMNFAVSKNVQEITVPIIHRKETLGACIIKSLEGTKIHRRHLYYLKFLTKSYGYHWKRLTTRSSMISSTHPTYSSMIDLMQKDKVYLQPNLDLSSLAAMVNKSDGFVSKLIHDATNLRFNDWVNSYRVEHVLKIMQDPKYDHYSISGYGFEAGFNSKSTFYKAFNKIKGLSPGIYKKNIFRPRS